VRVPMVDVGVVGVGVNHRRMNMGMRVGLASVPGKVVRMAMVLVVGVGVRVLQRLMCV